MNINIPTFCKSFTGKSKSALINALSNDSVIINRASITIIANDSKIDDETVIEAIKLITNKRTVKRAVLSKINKYI